MTYTAIRKNIGHIRLRKLIAVSVITGILSAAVAIALKNVTEHFQNILFHLSQASPLYLIVFPLAALLLIQLLRRVLFRKKENKGISEIFEVTRSKKKNLPSYKIASHFSNGMLTVIFGGSTGIEVSTVVAGAAVGSSVQQRANFLREHKTELISAGVAAAITALFATPFAGLLFALEVISKKATKSFFICTLTASAVAYAAVWFLDQDPIFAVHITTWHFNAIPYFILLGIFCGINSIYLTRSVIYLKGRFAAIASKPHRIILGSMILSTLLFILPQLYGDGYHAMRELFLHPEMGYSLTLLMPIAAILILKPIATSVTLASGGDGGVFAPSLFLGAFIGLLSASVMNIVFDARVIPINFMIIGMAAMLSASIHAPFTALFLVCGLINDYTLFIPILLVCLVSKYTAKMIYPYTVYTFATAPKTD